LPKIIREKLRLRVNWLRERLFGSIYPLFPPFYGKSFCESILKIFVEVWSPNPYKKNRSAEDRIRLAKGKRAKGGLGILGGNNPKTEVEAATIDVDTTRRTTIPRTIAPRAAA
jgi:hypothetical protein